MRSKLVFTGSLVAVLGLATSGCGGDDSESSNQPQTDAGTDTQPDGNTDAGGDTTPEATTALAPGGACTCDTDCAAFEGHAGLCEYGVCVVEATGPCPSRAVPDGCPENFLCYNSDMLDGRGTCWPSFDASSCSGVENRHEVCSATRGDTCETSCGAVCEMPAAPESGRAGSACSTDAECAYLTDGQCYFDDTPINRFIGGYCLSFGCTSDDQCGDDSACVPMASDGTGVCFNSCSNDFDCRAGYVCIALEDDPASFCFPGCDAAATCPVGFVCQADECIPQGLICSAAIPDGHCPEGAWCENGSCTSEPFVCDGDDALEPNDSRGTATVAAVGTTDDLTICDGDEDWFRVEVPADTIVKVGIQFKHPQGDLDLVVYDENGEVMGSRLGPWETYPEEYRYSETGSEVYGLYSKAGGAVYYLKAVGFEGATAPYKLELTHIPYVDGPDCETAGYTADECMGLGANGSGLIPLPFPDPDDGYVGAGYDLGSESNYRFGRREVVMALRYALHETGVAFGPASPLGISDIADITGTTPGYDVGDPRHPASTHDQGGNIDLAYWQTDGTNDLEIVCNDGSVHNDGYCSSAAVNSHIVDLERQAFFMAKLNATTRLRVIGVDQVLAPLIKGAADALAELPETDPKRITIEERNRVKTNMAYGSGWPFHHHHIHVSFQWWGGRSMPATETLPPSIFRIQPQGKPGMEQLRMSWPLNRGR